MRTKRKPGVRGGGGGFTLVEVLISLAIFAMGAVIISAGYLNVLSSYEASARRQRGDEDWKLVRAAVLAESDRVKVEEGGPLALADGRSLRWSAEIEPAEVADLFAVTLAAETEGGAAAETWSRRERIMLLRPGWSEPGEREELRAAAKSRREALRNP